MKRKYWLPPLLILAGFGLGWLVFGVLLVPPQPAPEEDIRQADSGYKFINPLLDCAQGQNAFTEIVPFKNNVESYVNQINDADPTVDFIAVYYRDLNDGPWFGINENTDFILASLAKVPVMITYYVEAESNPAILTQKYTYESSTPVPDMHQEIPPTESLVSGQSYTVNDLMFRMIVYSDNLAQDVLLEHIQTSTLAKVFNDFELPYPDEAVTPYQLTVKQYASFFRVLFNGSYLTRQYSEAALEMLAQSQFNDGLVAGVPSNIPVAHKFGEREFVGQTELQLHDCGIVYYPNHPYLLCIMSRGTNLTNMASSIAEVSQYVYNQLNAQLQANPSSTYYTTNPSQ